MALSMASQDVIHSFYVPALRLKHDVAPGRYTRLWFIVDRPRAYPIECSQFCGMKEVKGFLRIAAVGAVAWILLLGGLVWSDLATRFSGR